MPTNTYEPGLALNATTMVPAANATGTLRTAAGAAAQPVFDLLGNPLASLTTNAQGYYPPFKADIALGVLDFGSIVQPVISTEVRDSGPEAAAARDAALAAQTSANDAKAAADASAKAAADSAALVGAPADTAIAAAINGVGTATRGVLDATYANRAQAPRIEASKAGVKYDGTDQTVAMQALINTCSTFGVGVIELDGLVRCDGQLNIPATAVGTQARQAPLRITGSVQHLPGSTFTEATPFPKAGGLDLRYNGRTDTGCSTTRGAVIVGNAAAVEADRGQILTGPGIPDQCWILAVQVGVGYTVSTPARATAASVALTHFGGRIQALGYGTLELDHCQLVNQGTASSAPFVLTTGATAKVHHNLIAGHNSKTGPACDEDPYVGGGPGQGTALTGALTAGTAYTSLTVQPVPVDIKSGAALVIGYRTADAVTVTTTALVAKGSTTIPVTSFTPTTAHAARQSVYIGGWQVQETASSWDTPSAPYQGYSSRIHDNHFFRCRRVSAGGFASDLYVDHNSWMHNCGSNLAATPSTLTTALTAGTAYTTLAVTALSRDVLTGDVVQVGVGATSQETVAAADALLGATSITVNSFTANAAYAVGAKVFNTAHLGAAVESHALPGSVNAVTVADNRIGMSGGYTHATRYLGQTQQSTIAGNSLQDYHDNMLAAHRFDRQAQFNTVITGMLNPSIPVVDDWSAADRQQWQTVVTGKQGQRSTFPNGITTVGALGTYLPTTPGNSVYSPVFALSSGEQWQVRASGTQWVLTNKAANGTTYDVARWENSPAGVNISVNVPATNEARYTNDAGHLKFQVKAGYKVYLGDTTYQTNVYAMNGKLYADAVVVDAYASASRPTAASVGVGGHIFDTTLNKPIWSDGTNWRDAMGTIV